MNTLTMVLGAAVSVLVGMLINHILVNLPKRVSELEKSSAVQAECIKNIAGDISVLTSKMDRFVEIQSKQQSEFLADLMKVITKGDRRKNNRRR